MFDLDDCFSGLFDDEFDPEIIDDTSENKKGLEDYIGESQKRTMTFFILIDTSLNMQGERIALVNKALLETVPKLRDMQNLQSGVVIKVAVMTFDREARWLTPAPEALDRLLFTKIEGQCGERNIGLAFDMLYEKMNRKEFMNSSGGHYQPMILLISGGGRCSDVDSWPAKLERLDSKNMWFPASRRIAICFEDDFDREGRELFKKFSKNKDFVFCSHKPDVIACLIEDVLVGGTREVCIPNAETYRIDIWNKTPEWCKDIRSKFGLDY